MTLGQMLKCILVFFLFSCTLYAQENKKSKIDSLLIKLSTAKEDSAKVSLLLELSNEHKGGEAIKYGDKALSLSLRIKNKELTGLSYYNLGVQYRLISAHNKGVDYLIKSIDYLTDTTRIVYVYGTLSSLFRAEANDSLSMKYANKLSSLLRETNNDYYKAAIKSYLGYLSRTRMDTVSSDLNYKKSMSYFKEALIHLDKVPVNDNNREALNSYRVFVYNTMAKTDTDPYKGLEYALKALEIEENNPDSRFLDRFRGITLFILAQQNFLLSQKIKDKKNGYIDKADSYISRAIKSYSNESDNIYNEPGAYMLASRIKEAQYDYKSALTYYKQYSNLRDSLYSQDKKNNLAAIESQKEIQSRDHQIEISRLKLESRRKQIWAYIGGMFMLLVIVSLLFYENRNRKRKNRELARSNELKSRFFGILNHDLRSPISRLINYLQLTQTAPDILSDEESNAIQQKIIDNAHSLLENMENILFWCKDQMQTFTPEIKNVPVSQLFNGLENFFVYEENTKLLFEFDKDFEIRTDENYLITIMRNLTANSFKALDKKKDGKIIWKAIHPKKNIILSISDNGPGISEDIIKILYGEDSNISIINGLGFQIIRDLATSIKCQVQYKNTTEGATFLLIFNYNSTK